MIGAVIGALLIVLAVGVLGYIGTMTVRMELADRSEARRKWDWDHIRNPPSQERILAAVKEQYASGELSLDEMEWAVAHVLREARR